jgi:hypothetical protein
MKLEKCEYCNVSMDREIWEEEGHMCLSCSNLFYDHVINPYDPDTFPKNIKKDNCYVYGLGACGFFGGDSSLLDMIWADNIVEAMAQIRLEGATGVISIRKAVYGEFDCDNFTLAGHIPHTD